MEKKESTTQRKIPPSENPTSDENNGRESVPTTPTTSAWWGGWISQAKEKSASVFEAVKNDLNEITTAVTETFHVASEDESNETEISVEENLPQQSNTVNYMKQSISSFFGSVTDALIPHLDEEDATEAVLITSDDTIVLIGFAKHLAELQNNDETYLEEPSKTSEHAEKYKMWLEIVEQDQFTQQRVNKMLESSQILYEKYNKFVPDTVSHMNFFKRYLFKKALLEDELANEERRRKEVVVEKQPELGEVVEVQEETRPAEKIKETEEVSKSEVDDLEITNFELSEVDQIRLLEEYEQEIKEREKLKTDSIEVPTKSANKASKSPPKSSSNTVQSKGKNNKNVKVQQKQQKSTQQQSTKGDPKGKKIVELQVEKNHFKNESESSTSDESWEKEFDL